MQGKEFRYELSRLLRKLCCGAPPLQRFSTIRTTIRRRSTKFSFFMQNSSHNSRHKLSPGCDGPTSLMSLSCSPEMTKNVSREHPSVYSAKVLQPRSPPKRCLLSNSNNRDTSRQISMSLSPDLKYPSLLSPDSAEGDALLVNGVCRKFNETVMWEWTHSEWHKNII